MRQNWGKSAKTPQHRGAKFQIELQEVSAEQTRHLCVDIPFNIRWIRTGSQPYTIRIMTAESCLLYDKYILLRDKTMDIN